MLKSRGNQSRVCTWIISLMLAWNGTVGSETLCAQESETSRETAVKFSKRIYSFKTVQRLKLQADVYRHEDRKARPVIVWLHGGALIMGTRTGVPKQLLDLAEEAGFVLVSLDYRLAPEAQLPEIIDDLKDGLQWIQEQGPSLFHADVSRVVVAGASAGGYLALMSGVVAETPPLAIVSYWGFGDVDGDWTTKPSDAYRKGKLISKETAWAGVGTEVLTATNQENGRGRSTFFLYLKTNRRLDQGGQRTRSPDRPRTAHTILSSEKRLTEVPAHTVSPRYGRPRRSRRAITHDGSRIETTRSGARSDYHRRGWSQPVGRRQTTDRTGV